MSNVVQCDRCEKTTSGTVGGQWLHVSLGAFAQPGDRGGRAIPEGQRELDFCSYRCLAAWAAVRRDGADE